MAGGQFLGVRVEGAKELRRAIRKAEDDLAKDALKRANREGAETVAKVAKGLVPVDTGKLQASIRAGGGITKGTVRAGNKRAPYANIIHFGTSKIPANTYLFDAADASVNDVLDDYYRAVERIIVIAMASTK